MPYTNIIFVKFKLELLKDYRFTDKLNDSQKLVYLSLLLLAGMTDNSIPNDANYIKRILNLDMSPDTVEESIKHITEYFPKLLVNKEVISFSKFEEIHNYKIGKPEIEKGLEQNKNKKENKEQDSDNSLTSPLEAQFDIVWGLYPKKLGRKGAFRSYGGAVKGGAKKEDIIKAVNNYIGYIKDNKTEDKYIKHGSTFFNNWEDFLNYEPKPRSRTDLQPFTSRGK